MLIFFHLLTNDYFQCDFLNKLYIWSTLNNIWLPFHEVRFKEDQPWTTLLNHEQLFDVNQKLLASPLKNRFSWSSVFFSPIDMFHSTSNNQRISCFHKRNCTCFFFSITCALFNVDWFGYFLKVSNLIGLLEFYIALINYYTIKV